MKKLKNRKVTTDGKESIISINYSVDHNSLIKLSYLAGYRYKRKRYYVGYYDTELEAAKAYDLATESIHKNFQRKNYEQ